MKTSDINIVRDIRRTYKKIDKKAKKLKNGKQKDHFKRASSYLKASVIYVLDGIENR
jgi:hypothetical protein